MKGMKRNSKRKGGEREGKGRKGTEKKEKIENRREEK